MLNDDTSTPQTAPAKKPAPQQPQVYAPLGTKVGDDERKLRNASIEQELKEAVLALRAAGAPASEEELLSPLDRVGKVSTGYGYRMQPKKGPHPALDITTENKNNVNVVAMRSGTLVYVGHYSPDAGNAIMILADNGDLDFYAHLETGSTMHMHAGGRVRQGQIIGVMGETGFATAPHVHVTVRRLPPEALLESAKAQAQNVPGYVAPVIINANTGLPMPMAPLKDPAFDDESYKNIYPAINGLTYKEGNPVSAPPREVLMAGNPLPDWRPTPQVAAQAAPSTQPMPVAQADEIPAESGLPKMGQDYGKGQSPVPPFKR